MLRLPEEVGLVGREEVDDQTSLFGSIGALE